MTGAKIVPGNGSLAVPTSFNYGVLAADLADKMRDRAGRVRDIQRGAVLDVGRELIGAKARVEHGCSVKWVGTACQMNIRTAERAMRAVELVEKNDKLSYLPPDGLLALSARSAPQDVVNEIVGEIAVGETPTAARIKRRISEAKKAEVRARRACVEAASPTSEGEREQEAMSGGGPTASEASQAEQATTTNELVEMLVGWDRIDEFMALLTKANLSSVERALMARHERLVTERGLDGAEPKRISLAAAAVAEIWSSGGDPVVAMAPLVVAPELTSDALPRELTPVGTAAQAGLQAVVLEPSSEVATNEPIAIELAAKIPLVLASGPTGDVLAGGLMAIETVSEEESRLIVPEPSADVSAEDLMVHWSPLKPNTQWRGRQWLEDGCPITGRPDEHPIITKSLLPFRTVARKASLAQRERFLDMSAPSRPREAP